MNCLHTLQVDKLEQIEQEAKIRAQQEAGLKRHWRPIEDDYRGKHPFYNFYSIFKGVSERSNHHMLWLLLISVALLIFYAQYRRNRSKFWKLYYNYNDYKV